MTMRMIVEIVVVIMVMRRTMMVAMVMMDKMEKMMMVVTKTMHLVTSQVEVNMVGKVQRGCCCHCA